MHVPLLPRLSPRLSTPRPLVKLAPIASLLPTLPALASPIGAADEFLSGFATTALLAQFVAMGYTGYQLLDRARQIRESADKVIDSIDEDDDDPFVAENVKWLVMSILSALPLLNWTSWVFAAIDAPNERARNQYYVNAGLYLLPVLTGLAISPFAVLSTAQCAAHVQLERVRQTEPETIDRWLMIVPPSHPRKALPSDPQSLLDDLRFKAREASSLTISQLVLAREEQRALRDLQDTRLISSFELASWDEQFQARQTELIDKVKSMKLQELRGVARGLGMRGYSRQRRDELQGEILDRLR